MTPRESAKVEREVSEDAKDLAKEMARDMIELTRASWRIAGHFGKLALRTGEELAREAERAVERQEKARSREK